MSWFTHTRELGLPHGMVAEWLLSSQQCPSVGCSSTPQYTGWLPAPRSAVGNCPLARENWSRGGYLIQAKPVTLLELWVRPRNGSAGDGGLVTPTDEFGPEPALVPVFLEDDSPPFPSLPPHPSSSSLSPWFNKIPQDLPSLFPLMLKLPRVGFCYFQKNQAFPSTKYKRDCLCPLRSPRDRTKTKKQDPQWEKFQHCTGRNFLRAEGIHRQRQWASYSWRFLKTGQWLRWDL